MRIWAMNMAPLLSVDNLSVGYGDMTVIHGMSFNVEHGQFVSIVGSNSAGKTTLLNTLSGLLRPQQGTIIFQGFDITRKAPHEIVRAGLVQVPEGRELFPEMSVWENLVAGAKRGRSQRARQERMDELLEVFPALREKLSNRARTLSGGQQQMLAILRSLMCEPRLLVLDEPSFGLAPSLVRELLAVLQRLNREGTSILLVEQNIRQSLSICDFGYVLEKGRLVAEGPGRVLREDKRIVQVYLGM
jgi:branched-chain amino acid transport system ATP-binding protein